MFYQFICTLLGLCVGQILLAQPAISSFAPASGPVGSIITINGSSLNNPISVSVGSGSGLVLSGSATSLTVLVMPGATTGPVTVTTAGGTAAGSIAYTLMTNSNSFLQQGNKLKGNDNTGNANQGWSVALSADGNTALVGGMADNNFIGAIWVYTRSGGVWSQQGSKLLGAGYSGNPGIGTSVALSADGNTALVGGPADNSSFGAAWVFTRTGGIWAQQGNKITPTDAVGNARFGMYVALSADGNTAMIGGEL